MIESNAEKMLREAEERQRGITKPPTKSPEYDRAMQQLQANFPEFEQQKAQQQVEQARMTPKPSTAQFLVDYIRGNKPTPTDTKKTLPLNGDLPGFISKKLGN